MVIRTDADVDELFARQYRQIYHWREYWREVYAQREQWDMVIRPPNRYIAAPDSPQWTPWHQYRGELGPAWIRKLRSKK